MIPTPSTAHVSFDHVYEPAEDSYLLLDTLSSASETAWLTSRLNAVRHPAHGTNSPSPVVLEVGTGSGVVLAFLTAHATTILGRPDIISVGTDVNLVACQATRKTVETALHVDPLDPTAAPLPAFVGPLLADLGTPFRPGSVDVLIFNPPYVPSDAVPAVPEIGPAVQTGSAGADHDLLALSYAGGVDGMETTSRLLESLPTLLNPARGVAYVLLCAHNRPELVKQGVLGWGAQWRAETVGRSGKQAGWEKLQIIRIWRQPTVR